MTAIGTAMVFIGRDISRKVLDGMIGFSAGVLGAAAVVARPLLPYALSFAAGAIIFVVVEEVIPESQHSNNADFATMAP
jgi:ZIP family zinc transporter